MSLKLPWNTNDRFSLCNVTHFRMRLNLWERAFKSDHMYRKTHISHLRVWSRMVSLKISYLSCSTCELITKRKKNTVMSVTVKDVILFNFLLYWSNCVYKNMENECCVSIKQRNKTKYQNVELFLHLKLKWHKWKNRLLRGPGSTLHLFHASCLNQQVLLFRGALGGQGHNFVDFL